MVRFGHFEAFRKAVQAAAAIALQDYGRQQLHSSDKMQLIHINGIADSWRMLQSMKALCISGQGKGSLKHSVKLKREAIFESFEAMAADTPLPDLIQGTVNHVLLADYKARLELMLITSQSTESTNTLTSTTAELPVEEQIAQPPKKRSLKSSGDNAQKRPVVDVSRVQRYSLPTPATEQERPAAEVDEGPASRTDPAVTRQSSRQANRRHQQTQAPAQFAVDALLLMRTSSDSNIASATKTEV